MPNSPVRTFVTKEKIHRTYGVASLKVKQKKKKPIGKKKSKIGSFSAAILLLRIFTIFFIVSLWHILRVFVT